MNKPVQGIKEIADPEENSLETRQFRRRALTLVALVFIGYGGFKYYQVSTALKVWKQQTSGAGHRGSVPPNR